jgi:hypothetical protein
VHRRLATIRGTDVEYAIGGSLRHDAIGAVGLYRTAERRRLSTIREYSVDVTAGGLFARADITLAPAIRMSAGFAGQRPSARRRQRHGRQYRRGYGQPPESPGAC